MATYDHQAEHEEARGLSVLSVTDGPKTYVVWGSHGEARAYACFSPLTYARGS